VPDSAAQFVCALKRAVGPPPLGEFLFSPSEVFTGIVERNVPFVETGAVKVGARRPVPPSQGDGFVIKPRGTLFRLNLK
jgi:hypothetical protein